MHLLRTQAPEMHLLRTQAPEMHLLRMQVPEMHLQHRAIQKMQLRRMVIPEIAGAEIPVETPPARMHPEMPAHTVTHTTLPQTMNNQVCG